MIGLDKMLPGQEGKVIKVEGQGVLRRRLLDMGLTPGTTVNVHNVAPLGDPMEIRLRGYELSIRKEDAKGIIIECESEKKVKDAQSIRGNQEK